MYGKILKNTSWLIIAQIITKAVSFFYVIFLARNLGVENFGLYIVAISYFSLISSIADFGVSRYVVREVAKDHQSLPEILSNIIFLRVTLMAVIFALFALLMYNIDPSKTRVALSLVAVLAVLPQAVAISLDSAFVALQKLSFSAISLSFYNIFSAAIGFILVSRGFGAFGAVAAVILGQIIYVLCLFFFLIKQRIPLFSKIKENLFKEIILGSLPYGLLGILGLLYFKIDTLLLSYLKGSYDTGIYGAAYKFLEAIIFVPSSLSIALFPVLARLHDGKNTGLKNIYFKILIFMGGLGVIVLIGYLVVLPGVIKLFLPKFLPSIEVVKILSLSIPFMFIHIPLSQIILSTDRYLQGVVKLSLASLFFNILLNLIFIPKFSFLAAAWVTVASDVFSLIIIAIYIQRNVLRGR
ncbi:flippase [Candidatus Daviesbacteria bacterium]|nr:flippase [Candidatus Daviesbacteria bacterium]